MLSWVIIVVMVSFHLIQSRIIKKQINSCNTRAYVTAQVAIFLPFFGQFKMAAKVISTRPFTALQSSRIPFKTIPTLNQFRLNWRDNNATVNKLVSQISHSEGRQTVTRLVDQPMTSRYHFINRALVHSTDQSSFRAVSEQFQSSFRAVSGQLLGAPHLNTIQSSQSIGICWNGPVANDALQWRWRLHGVAKKVQRHLICIFASCVLLRSQRTWTDLEKKRELSSTALVAHQLSEMKVGAGYVTTIWIRNSGLVERWWRHWCFKGMSPF